MAFYLRTESIKADEIVDLSVLNHADNQTIAALKSAEPCLVEGSRGTGKSFLMRVAEGQLEKQEAAALTVFVSFNISSLVTTDDPLQFYHWMLAKTLKTLINRLRKRGLSVSPFAAGLLSNDESNKQADVEKDLREIVKRFEESYRSKEKICISSLPDIEDVKEAIEEICSENGLDRIYIFFDEAAHVFRPDQQRQFFSLFKDLRSPFITCNAAIYPGVTYFGDSFEPNHDCIYRRIERNISDADYLQYFRAIVDKQADDNLKKTLDAQTNIFNSLALASGGNPRILLRTIQDLDKVNTASANAVLKAFYRGQIWAEHTELGEKYGGHKVIVDWGRDFLEQYVIPAIEAYNSQRKERNQNEATIYFWVHKDCPASVKEALRLLSYTGIIRKIDASVRATRRELGTRYEVKYGCVLASEGNPVTQSKDFFESLSLKKFPEFGKNHAAYFDINDIEATQVNDQQYLVALNAMLSKSVDVLPLLTSWQKGKLKDANIKTIEQLHQNSEEDLIDQLYRVGPVRARLMKNAATAELLEYLSG
ncbi:hypothetical protein [Roseibium sp.]|uniref:hypothetical protein n=1 Tax=Roseibium sp. TaxID=1936156 RepID=UPI003BAED88F